ncbi:hypothetical protein TKK_0014634 [Trichogramma kaykai]
MTSGLRSGKNYKLPEDKTVTKDENNKLDEQVEQVELDEFEEENVNPFLPKNSLNRSFSKKGETSIGTLKKVEGVDDLSLSEDPSSLSNTKSIPSGESLEGAASLIVINSETEKTLTLDPAQHGSDHLHNNSQSSNNTPENTVQRSLVEEPIITMSTYIKLKDAIAIVPIFNKKELGLEDFLETVDYANDLISSAEKPTFLKLVQSKIGSEARKALKDAKIDTLAKLKEHLRALYNSGLSVSSLQGLLAQQMQRENESVLAFANRIRDLGNQIIQAQECKGEVPEHFKESTRKSQEESFRNGLLDEISVRLPATNDLTELIKEAIRVEKAINVKREMRKRLEKYCSICKRTNHNTENCRQKLVAVITSGNTNNSQQKSQQKSAKPQCDHCKKLGHTIDKCFKRAYDLANAAQTQTQTQTGDNKPTCTKCGKTNHTTDRCLNHIIYSGSEVNLCMQKAVPDKALIFLDNQPSIIGINSNVTETLSVTEFKINTILTQFLIISNSFPICFDGIMGADFVVLNRVEIDFGSKKLTIQDKSFKLFFEDQPLLKQSKTTLANYRQPYISKLMPYIKINLYVYQAMLLLDTGAQISVIYQRVIPKGLNINSTKKLTVEDINGQSKETLGRVTIMLCEIPTIFHVVDETFDLPGDGILGVNFFHLSKAKLNFESLLLNANNYLLEINIGKTLADPYEMNLSMPPELNCDFYDSSEDNKLIELIDLIPDSCIFTIQKEKQLKDFINVDKLDETEKLHVQEILNKYSDIFHIPGKLNVNADSSSRNVPEELTEQVVCSLTRSELKENENIQNIDENSRETVDAPRKRGRPPKNLQKPKPNIPARNPSKRVIKPPEKFDPSNYIKPPEPNPKTFEIPPSESEKSDDSDSERESTDDEEQQSNEAQHLSDDAEQQPDEVESQPISNDVEQQLNPDNIDKLIPEIVYSKNLMHCLAGNIAYFIDTKSNPCDAGAKKLAEFNKLPRITDINTNEVHIFESSKKTCHFVLCIKNEDDIAPTTCKENILFAMSVLRNLLEKRNQTTIFCTKTNTLYGLSWDDIVQIIMETFENTKMRIVVCTGEITYVPISERDEIFYEMHSSAIGGHRGVSKTYNRIKKKYLWENLKNYIQRRIQQCLDCQLKKLVRVKTRQPMLITDTPGIPFYKIALDIVGPLPKSKNNFEYILTMQDNFSKFCLAVPLVDITAVSVADAFIKRFISIFGSPKVILTDQGSNFMSSLMKRLPKRFKIKQIKTTPYHAQSNGSLECSHHVLKEFLKQYTVSDDAWDEWVDLAILNYNTSVQESTKLTPYEIIFGRIANLPTSLPLRENPIKNQVGRPKASYSQKSKITQRKKVAEHDKTMSHEEAYDVAVKKFKKDNNVEGAKLLDAIKDRDTAKHLLKKLHETKRKSMTPEEAL